MDYQRQTCDELVTEARRDPLPLPRWKTLEYAVHGKWKMRADGSSFSVGEVLPLGAKWGGGAMHIKSTQWEVGPKAPTIGPRVVTCSRWLSMDIQ